MPAPYIVTIVDPTQCQINYLDGGDPARRLGLENAWRNFVRTDPSTGRTFPLYYRWTSAQSGVAVDYTPPPDLPPGRYRIDTFVPAQFATARQVSFSVFHNARTINGHTQYDEARVVVDTSVLEDVWKSLGEYDIDLSRGPREGQVRQVDGSSEYPLAKVAFGPVRWRPAAGLEPEQPALPPGEIFDSPVGTPEERRQPFPIGGYAFARCARWVGEWFDVTPFLSWYIYGCHTGADLNLPGASAADRGKPIYAVGDGVVTYAGKAGSWGNIVVIEHPVARVTLPDGRVQRQPVYSRYGHVDDNILVRSGQPVIRGQQIAAIGLAAGAVSGWHLHFDISYTDLLKRRPAHWPNTTHLRSIRSGRNSAAYQKAQAAVRKEVLAHYVDPLEFIRENHVAYGG